MKKLLGILSMLFIGWTSMNAMPYEEAKDRARFLTDKMAYELNLNDAQYNDAYEINLDYFMNIRTESDLYGSYWTYRNADLRHILYDWQYALFSAADYFFRPAIWRANTWLFPIYGLYRVNHFYYDPPRVYHVYRGGHYAHHHQHRVSYYAHRRPTWNGGFRGASRNAVTSPQQRHKAVRRDNGFRFESTKKLDRGTKDSKKKDRTTAHRKENNKNGFQIGAPRQQNKGSKGKSDAVSRNNKKPQVNSAQRNQKSSYNRPSSTRTTVNRTPARSSQSKISRPQSNNRPKSNTTRQGASNSRGGKPTRR